MITEHKGCFGVKPICTALGVGRATYYRRQSPRTAPRRGGYHPRALSAEEHHKVLNVLHEERFCDQAPGEVYATLLDEGHYLCSERTMYRILAENHEVRERRDQLRHPRYAPPELLATRPNEVWSWDITKLLGPSKWTYFYLYVILGYLQPLRGGLDGGVSGICGVGPAFDRPNHKAPRHRARKAHASRRPGLVDDLQAGGAVVGGSGSDQDP